MSKTTNEIQRKMRNSNGAYFDPNDKISQKKIQFLNELVKSKSKDLHRKAIMQRMTKDEFKEKKESLDQFEMDETSYVSVNLKKLANAYAILSDVIHPFDLDSLFFGDSNSLQLSLNRELSNTQNLMAIATALSFNKTISNFELWGFRIESMGEMGADMLMINDTLTNLIFKVETDLEFTYSFMNGLKYNQTITSLNISIKSDEAALALANCLKINKSIVSLNLRFNRFRAKGMKALSNMLKINKSLVSLDISAPLDDSSDDNTVHYRSYELEEAKALADMLKMNNTLTFLNLRDCNIVSEGITLLSQSLKANQSLVALDLYGNNINEWSFLFNSLKSNITLLSLNLEHTRTVIPPIFLGKILERNRILRGSFSSNWKRIAILMSFVQANESNALKYSILPLIPIITALDIRPIPRSHLPEGFIPNDSQPTNLNQFMYTHFYKNHFSKKNCINVDNKTIENAKDRKLSNTPSKCSIQ